MGLCAGGEDGKDACGGDSGGPFTVADSQSGAHTLVGAVSFGHPYPLGMDVHGRDCTEFMQMFHSSERGLTNKSPPKEELLSAPRMSSQSKHCNQKYILPVFQHLSCISDDPFI